jgi:hypothetical protein
MRAKTRASSNQQHRAASAALFYFCWLIWNRDNFGGYMRYVPMLFLTLMLLCGCTQEAQNQLGRRIQNWTGTNGVMEIYAGDKLVRRFIKVDKLSTAYGTSDREPRGYRFGYGVPDINLNGQVDADEKKVYFEVSEFSTYVFYEQP